MRFKDFYEAVISEMIIQGRPPEDKDYVIAFDKWIWALDEDDLDEEVMQDIADKAGLDKEPDTSDVYSFITSLQEEKDDILAGQITGDNLYLYDYGSFKLDPKSSILVKKVVKQLGLDSASYIEDVDSTETTVSKEEMKGKMPDVAYHGTSTRYLDSILRKGLRPSEADSNYAKQGIHHPDLIFFSTRIGEAMHHAQHTALEKGGEPIILAFKVKDKDQVIPDYDVETLTGKSSFYDFHNPESSSFGKAYNKKGGSLSREFGVYGYKGKILPMHFTTAWIANKPAEDVYNIENDFVELEIEGIKAVIDKIGDWESEGMGLSYYDAWEAGELDDEEEEEY